MDKEPTFMMSKRSGVSLEPKDAKKLKTQDESQAKEGVRKLTEEQLTNMVFIETDVLNVEPLQARYPVVGWEIYSDSFGVAWKIIRTGNVTSICRDFEDVVRSCDREDLDTLWRIIQDQSKRDELVDVKAQELWVHFRRLYEPDPSDRYWRFEAHNMNTLWKFYDFKCCTPCFYSRWS